MPYFTNLKDWYTLRKFWFMIRYVTIYRQYCNKTSKNKTNPSQTEISLKYQRWAASQTGVQAIFEVILQIEIT